MKSKLKCFKQRIAEYGFWLLGLIPNDKAFWEVFTRQWGNEAKLDIQCGDANRARVHATWAASDARLSLPPWRR